MKEKEFTHKNSIPNSKVTKKEESVLVRVSEETREIVRNKAFELKITFKDYIDEVIQSLENVDHKDFMELVKKLDNKKK